jgi:hypothetical protein
MRVISLGTTDCLTQQWVQERTFHTDHNSLCAFVAYHDALQNSLWHRLAPLLGLRFTLVQDRPDKRDIAPLHTELRGVFQLTRGLLETQIVFFFFRLQERVLKLIIGHGANVNRFHLFI